MDAGSGSGASRDARTIGAKTERSEPEPLGDTRLRGPRGLDPQLCPFSFPNQRQHDSLLCFWKIYLY